MLKKLLLFLPVLALAAPFKPQVIFTDVFENPIEWTEARGVEFKQAKPLNYLYLDIAAAKGKGNATKITGQQDAFGRRAVSDKKAVSISRDVTEELKKYVGYRVEVSAEIACKNIPTPPVPWEGVRLILNCRGSGKGFESCVNGVYGTRNWKRYSFQIRIPFHADKMTLVMGLISTQGTAQIRNLQIKTVALPYDMLAKKNRGPVYTNRTLPRLRGFNALHSGKTFQRMRNDFKANIYKFWMQMPDAHLSDKEFFAEVDKNLDRFAAGIPQVKEAGSYVILHSDRGKKNFDKKTGSDSFYSDPVAVKRFVQMWEHAAKRFKGNDTIWGFELLNETQFRIPKPLNGCPDYEGLMELTAKAINRIDPARAVIVQPEEWYGMDTWHKMRPINAKNIIYAVHFYEPFAVTHQNLFKETKPAVPYPGMINGTMWNRATLRRMAEAAVRFQKATNSHMVVTEFSVIRWAPGAEKWLDDVISVFEELGWDWLYHDFQAWPGWNPELSADRNSEKYMPNNPRAQVLRKWMHKNQFRPVNPQK